MRWLVLLFFVSLLNYQVFGGYIEKIHKIKLIDEKSEPVKYEDFFPKTKENSPVKESDEIDDSFIQKETEEKHSKIEETKSEIDEAKGIDLKQKDNQESNLLKDTDDKKQNTDGRIKIESHQPAIVEQKPLTQIKNSGFPIIFSTKGEIFKGFDNIFNPFMKGFHPMEFGKDDPLIKNKANLDPHVVASKDMLDPLKILHLEDDKIFDKMPGEENAAKVVISIQHDPVDNMAKNVDKDLNVNDELDDVQKNIKLHDHMFGHFGFPSFQLPGFLSQFLHREANKEESSGNRVAITIIRLQDIDKLEKKEKKPVPKIKSEYHLKSFTDFEEKQSFGNFMFYSNVLLIAIGVLIMITGIKMCLFISRDRKKGKQFLQVDDCQLIFEDDADSKKHPKLFKS